MPFDAAPLIRPSLLCRAAAAGARLYRRERDLGRILPKLTSRADAAIVAALAAAEAACEAERREGAAAYAPSRHVGLLSALLAEGAARA